CARYGNYEGYW
nr:immunoglobulin heavy chain junction region [Mus musculus]